MKLTVWCNHQFPPSAEATLVAGLGEHRLIQSDKAARAVTVKGHSDPAMAEADIVFGQPDVDDAMAASRLRWIELSSAGYTRYDRDEFRTALRARGAILTSTSAVFATPCAEHVLAMLLALNRRLPEWWQGQQTDRGWPYFEGRLGVSILTGQVVLLGYGSIGRRLAELLAPFRVRLIALRRQPLGDEARVEVVTEAGLARALAVADHVVNILSANPTTHRFVNAARLAQLRPAARYYNVGRGTTVDQDALIAALRGGRLDSAYLDVTEPEPLPPEHPLWSTPNCHIIPHMGGRHRGQHENLARHFLENLRRFERDEPLIDRVI